METEKATITKGRGPRRVGLKRTSISKSMPSPVDIDSASKVDSEETDSPAVKSIENDVPKTDVPKDDDVTLGLRLEVNNVTDSVDHSTSVEPQVEVKEDAVKALKSEENETEVSSEDSEEFHGFQSLPSPDGKAKPILTKLLGEAESELDCENNMSDSDKMDVDPENDAADAADIAVKVATKSVENGKPSLSEDEDVKEADGSFDNMKLLSEVSSEVTSSNDISNTNLNDSPVKASDETTSEVTSSATNSPSLSAARGNGKSSASRKSLVSSPANVSRKSIANKKTSVDVSNPAFRKPFDFGWKRELVYRNSNETSSKVMADIYYYTPAGKKIRSNREVSEHLHGVDLTTDNFTFFKEALGVEDPEKEIIRVAKRVSGVTAQRSPQPKKQATPKPPRPLKEVKEKESPESAVKVGGPKAAARSFPRIKITPTQLMRGSPSSGGKGKGKRIRSSSDDGDMEMGMLPPTWNPSAAKKGMNSLEPCSLRCLGLMGHVPSLQCRLCLCLYHSECVGLGAINDPSMLHGYVCKNCQDKKNGKSLVGSAPVIIAKAPAPPLLTPISAMGGNIKNEKTVGGVQKSPPQLTRLPRPNDPKMYTIPRYVKVQGQDITGVANSLSQVRVQCQQPMVGGVTTWLPPSSTIQMTSNPKSNNTTAVSTAGTATTTDSSSSNVQSIAILNGKKYIVVSKHNVLSVSNPSTPTTTVAKSRSDSPIECTPTTLGSGLVVTNSGQVVMASGDNSNMGLVPAVGSQVQGAGGPILPKPSTYMYSGGQNQSGGVLLVPWVSSNPSAAPNQLGNKNTGNGQQLYLVNGPNGNFVVSGLPGQIQMDTAEAGETPAPSSSKKRKRDVEKDTNVAKRGKKSGDVCELEHSFMEFFANNLSAGYSAIKQVFQYLKVKELLRAARVCKMWRDLAGHESLWRIVRMKNSQVDDWEGFVTSLVRHGTQQLDLRKILLPNDPDDINKMWRSFLKEMSRATGIVRIDLCRCPAFVVEELPLACPQLTVVNALAIKCSTISLDTLANFTDIQELRLKSMTGIHLTSSLAALKGLKNLKHLSLTTFKDLGKAGPEVINSLTNLETLEIGECSDFPEDFGKEVLPNLTKLTSLRLEKGQGKTCPTFSLLAGVKELPTLNQLELVNFDVKTGFSEALAQCTNIKRLLIIPTYVTQSATTNHMVLAGVTELSESLSHFVWGVTHELLRVTELFIDQCDTKEGGGTQGKVPKAAKSPDSIPILKPDASSKIDDWEGVACKSMSSPVGQVEILTLTKLQQVLTKSLPNTKIKILKVAFQSTWRQSISEPNP